MSRDRSTNRLANPMGNLFDSLSSPVARMDLMENYFALALKEPD
jgi:hypothetical protein